MSVRGPRDDHRADVHAQGDTHTVKVPLNGLLTSDPVERIFAQRHLQVHLNEELRRRELEELVRASAEKELHEFARAQAQKDFQAEEILTIRPAKLQRPAPAVLRVPGWRVGEFLRRVCSKRAYELEIQPTFNDMWLEYTEAVAEGRSWRARFVLVHGHISVARTLGLGLAVRLLKFVVKIWTNAG